MRAMGQSFRSESGCDIPNGNACASWSRENPFRHHDIHLTGTSGIRPRSLRGHFVILDVVTAASFGLPPRSPVGVIGTSVTMKMPPVWKPSYPKRFAWTIGALTGAVCLTFRLRRLHVAWLIAPLGICFTLKWLEAVYRFCVGCWMHAKLFKCEPCQLR